MDLAVLTGVAADSAICGERLPHKHHIKTVMMLPLYTSTALALMLALDGTAQAAETKSQDQSGAQRAAQSQQQPKQQQSGQQQAAQSGQTPQQAEGQQQGTGQGQQALSAIDTMATGDQREGGPGPSRAHLLVAGRQQ